MIGVKNQRGFTLIELIVVIGIFSIVVTVVMGSLLLVLRGQRALLIEKQAAENVRFSLEFMARQMRVVNRYDEEPGQPVGCVDIGTSFKIPSSSEVYFLNRSNECIHFYLEDGVIQFDNGIDTIAVTSSSQVSVEALTFTVVGEDENDSQQPLVTILVTAQGPGEGEEDAAASTTAQTTVSVRNIDVPGN